MLAPGLERLHRLDREPAKPDVADANRQIPVHEVAGEPAGSGEPWMAAALDCGHGNGF